MHVIPGRAKSGMRLTGFPAGFYSGESRFNRFGSFGSGLNNKVRNKSLAHFFNGVVSSVVQLYSVLFGVLPAIFTNKVKGIGELLKSIQQGSRLLRAGIQFELNCSSHNTFYTIYWEIMQGVKEGCLADASKERHSSASASAL